MPFMANFKCYQLYILYLKKQQQNSRTADSEIVNGDNFSN